MRYLFLSVLLLATGTSLVADQPPAEEPDFSIVFETRTIAIPVDSPLLNGKKEGDVAFLSNEDLKLLLESVQGDRRANIMQSPKLTTFNGQEAVVRVGEQQMFVTGLDVRRIGDDTVCVPRNETFDLGTTLVLTGRASADRRFIEVKVKYTNVQLQGEVPLIPVVTAITPMKKDGAKGKMTPFTQFLQAPHFETVKIEKADLRIASGAHAVITGPTSVQEVRTETSVPALSRIPYMSRLFRNISNSKLTMRTILVVSPTVMKD